MTTARDIISDALSSLGEQTQDDSDLQVGVRLLNRMIGTWANESLSIYTTTEETFTMTAGTNSYSTSLFADGRPVSIASMFLRLSSIDYPVASVTETEFDGFAYKPAAGLPAVYQYDPTYPNGTLYFYPTPSDAYVAHVKANYPLIAGTVDLTTAIALPPGYEAALVDNLAVKLAPHFGIEAPGSVQMAARASKGAIQTTNHVPLRMVSGLGGDGYTPGWVRILGDT